MGVRAVIGVQTKTVLTGCVSPYVSYDVWTYSKPIRDVKREELVMQTTCGAYELLFWGGKSISQPEPSATKFRDVVWATWTSVLGWPVQGIWPAVSWKSECLVEIIVSVLI